MRMQAAVVVAVAFLVAPTPSSGQAGLLSDARQRAADVAHITLRISPDAGPDNNWRIMDPVVDEFTDSQGQSAWLFGRNYRLVLLIGCSGGEVDALAIGGLGGATSIRRGRVVQETRNIIFQGGSVDLRWGEGPVEPQDWVDGDLLLAASRQNVIAFLDAAATGENRLRARARATRNRIIQDEFDLTNLEVTLDSARMVRRRSDPLPLEELSCAR